MVFLSVIPETKNEQKRKTWNSPVGQIVRIDLILILRTSQQGLHTRLVLYFSVAKNTQWSTLPKAADWMFYEQLRKVHEWHLQTISETLGLLP